MKINFAKAALIIASALGAEASASAQNNSTPQNSSVQMPAPSKDAIKIYKDYHKTTFHQKLSDQEVLQHMQSDWEADQKDRQVIKPTKDLCDLIWESFVSKKMPDVEELKSRINRFVANGARVRYLADERSRPTDRALSLAGANLSRISSFNLFSGPPSEDTGPAGLVRLSRILKEDPAYKDPLNNRHDILTTIDKALEKALAALECPKPPEQRVVPASWAADACSKQ